MKTPPTPKQVTSLEIFQQANAFFQTIHHLHSTADRAKFAPMAVPVGVLSAFAAELMLKCLVHIETGQLPNKLHLLHDLFLKLRPETQKRLEDLWDCIMVERKEILDKIDATRGTPRPRDLRSNLLAGNDAFRQLRYVYEGGADFEFFLSDLPIILRQRILELKPEWLR
jgi:hypothetical protein